jgi:hypothetical protein
LELSSRVVSPTLVRNPFAEGICSSGCDSIVLLFPNSRHKVKWNFSSSKYFCDFLKNNFLVHFQHRLYRAIESVTGGAEFPFSIVTIDFAEDNTLEGGIVFS